MLAWSRTARRAVIVIAAAVLCSCGNAPAPGGPAVVTPTPRGACPITEEPAEGCVPYDPDAAMAANDGYRQRGDLPAEYRVRAEEHRERITAVLQEALARGPLTAEGLFALLDENGYAGVQAYGRSDADGGMAVGIATDAGCVFGVVSGTDVELEAGAGIADGGCLPAQGH